MDHGGGTSTRCTAAATAVKAFCGTVHSIVVECSASDGSIIVRDGGASGTIRFQHSTLAGGGAYCVVFPGGLRCTSSIYVTLSDAVAIVHFT